ncbi:MAG: aminotransferase class I/II-fold pyridoxal phosphate-dependent enzyme [Fimbriimonadaceae bacterium]|nr:aminotransferase class I/II-fold pyridoxal phosphate-dependent enzyme [Fimbriimonadaceae bacterium]
MPTPSRRFESVPPYLFAEVARAKREAIARGVDVIDLGIGDPDIPTPKPVIEALCAAAHNPRTHRYDESANGWPAFLNAAKEWYAKTFGVPSADQGELCQVIGSKEGLAHLAWAFIDHGDVAIVPNPGYPVYKVNTLMAGGEVFEVPLREENAFLPRLVDIPTEAARRAKLFYVCYPNNPTAAVATSEFYADAIRFCRDHDILLVNDMAYATVTYDGLLHPTALQAPGSVEHVIEFHSLSKMFNMTGWRLGFAIGNPGAIQALQAMKSNIDSKQFGAIAEAGAVALSGVDNRETMALYAKRRDYLCDGLAALGWEVPKPKATLFVWARVPRDDMSSAEFCAALIEKAGIVAVPGNGAGSEGEGFVRMSLTLPGDVGGERYAEAVRRIGESGLVPSRAGV